MRIPIRIITTAIVSCLGFSAAAAVQPGQMAIASKATQFIGVNRSLAALTTGDEAIASSVVSGPDGAQHIRFTRQFNGVPVIGGDFIVHMPKAGPQSVTTTFDSASRPASMQAGVNPDVAIAAARTAFAGVLGDVMPGVRLVVLAYGVPTPTLAYEVKLRGIDGGIPADETYYVDAQNKKVLLSFSNIRTQRQLPVLTPKPSVGIGNTRYLGSVQITTSAVGGQTGYKLIDPTRGNGSVEDARNRTNAGFAIPITDKDNVWGDGTGSHPQTAAADAFYGIAATWDYYKEVHGRHGIWGDGRGVTSYVHIGLNYANAFWNGQSMHFGDGDGRNFHALTALDVAGHEMSHGVVEATADLIYEGQAGGLNESSADIFGTMVERNVAGKLGREFNWTIGEDAAGPELRTGPALRYMYKPSLDLYINSKNKEVSSFDCYGEGIDDADVHHSSGVGNRFFYLLSEGAVAPPGTDLSVTDLTCKSVPSLVGIGADAAEKIWYLALSAYFTSDTDYPGARIGTLKAAADIYGADSAQVDAVAAAWDAVLVP
ncbi:M4 family metallopeptidase [Stenotrophomonas humi]